MKCVNGLDATRRLVALFLGAKVLMVTNFDDAALRQGANGAGASGFFLKANLLALRSFLTIHWSGCGLNVRQTVSLPHRRACGGGGTG